MISEEILSKNFSINDIKNDNNFSPLSDIERFDININWEILFGCSERCDGCYVNKFDESTLKYQEDEVNYLWDKMMSYELKPHEAFKELVLGPTDITNNLNIDSLITNQKFIDIVNKFPFLAVTGSFLCDDESMMKFIEWKNRLFPEHELEFLVAFDINKLLEDEKSYIERVKRNVNLIYDNVVGHFEHAFTLNMKHYDITEEEYFRVMEILRVEFGVIFELNPSFFRTHRKEHIKGILDYFKKFLGDFENKNDIMLAHRNLHHAEFSYNTVLVKGMKMYKMPFLYENSVLLDDDLAIGDDFRQCTDYNKIQLDYIKENKLEECLTCELLYNCMNRNIINIMKHYDFKDCIVPKDCIIGLDSCDV